MIMYEHNYIESKIIEWTSYDSKISDKKTNGMTYDMEDKKTSNGHEHRID